MRQPPTADNSFPRTSQLFDAITAGPISLRVEGQSVDNVWGLSVTREYTAAANTGYQLDIDGTPGSTSSASPSGSRAIPVFCPAEPGHPDCRDPNSLLLQDLLHGERRDRLALGLGHGRHPARPGQRRESRPEGAGGLRLPVRLADRRRHHRPGLDTPGPQRPLKLA
jgi:hypothetical protein